MRMLPCLVLLSAILFLLVTETSAQTVINFNPSAEEVLYNFNMQGGTNPQGGLIFDGSGNLYGTTLAGGSMNCGTVFELTPKANGGSVEQVLFNFKGQNDNDSCHPIGSLIFDSAGNLYGVTAGLGYGTVFELTPDGQGGWTEQLLHNFMHDFHDGENPTGGLIMDAAGNLYGTTAYGGSDESGTVFELTPQAGGGWTETIVHQFMGNDGQNPSGSLVFDAKGNLYGTTILGGFGAGLGTVFELNPSGNGAWAEQQLYSFDNSAKDGYYPYANLIFDGSGNLYGVTKYGGRDDFGTVFELSRNSNGNWAQRMLHSFNGADGYYPVAGLTLDPAGNLYGTTYQGGAYNTGVVFELQPTATGGGGWAESVLHSFANDGTDGYHPYAGVIFGGSGILFGTTADGGTYGYGTVFGLKP